MVATASILVLSLVFITSVTIGQFLPRALALIRLPGIQWISSFFVFLALAFALHVFYRVFPNRKVPFRPAIAAAVAAAMSISAARFVFDIFINSTFADYGAVYGSLAWIVSLALWSYVVATLFLLGAEFGSVLEGIH
jgi:membrane protein